MRGKAVALSVLAATLILLTPAASASMITGILDIEGTGVKVTSTLIDWAPLGGGVGDIQSTLIGTTLTYDAGTPLGSAAGKIIDLAIAAPFPIVGFMTFASAPGLSFNLDSVGPGSSNTVCSPLANFASCSVYAGSPFVLTRVNNTTTISLTANGTVTDSMGDLSSWTGSFTAQVPLLPGVIQTDFLNTGSYSLGNSYSGTFLVTVPESSTSVMALAGLGLLLLGRIRRRRA